MRFALVLALFLCGCHKRPPAPWTHDELRVEVVYPGGGGGGPMEVYQGSERHGSFGGDAYNGNENYRILKIAGNGITLEVEIEGYKETATGEKLPYHVHDNVTVPYEGEIASLPVIDDRIFRAWFIPNRAATGGPTPTPFVTGFHVQHESDPFAEMGLGTNDFVGSWRSREGMDYELRPDFSCRASSAGVSEEGTWKLEPPNKLELALSAKKTFAVSPMFTKMLWVVPANGQPEIWVQTK